MSAFAERSFPRCRAYRLDVKGMAIVESRSEFFRLFQQPVANLRRDAALADVFLFLDLPLALLGVRLASTWAFLASGFVVAAGEDATVTVWGLRAEAPRQNPSEPASATTPALTPAATFLLRFTTTCSELLSVSGKTLSAAGESHDARKSCLRC